MSGKVFFDTNVLVYAHTDIDTVKQSIAQNLILNNESFISSQVIQELANTLFRKFKHTWKDIEKVVTEAIDNNSLQINSGQTVLKACKIAERYAFSFYDSLIIAAAIECECTVLYSEDMNHGQIIEEKLKIINPFL